MQHTVSKLKIGKTILFIGMAAVLLFIGSCKGGGDDPTPDPTDTTKKVTDEMYIILNGLKVTCKVPASDYRTFYDKSNGDTSVQWSGNIPSGVGGDTTLYIGHPGPRLLGTKYTVKSPAFGDAKKVEINLRWGIIAGHPYVFIDGGDYTLEKIKGKWVSTLKNGTGYDIKDNTKKYSGIEFRMIWP